METSYNCALGRHRKRCESKIGMGHAEWGNAVEQLVETLRYQPEGGGFDSRWVLFIDIIFPAALWPCVPLRV